MAKMMDKSPWLKSVLVPFWILQLLFMIILVAAIAYLFQFSIEAAELVIMVICDVCIILNVTEIILLAKRNLQPITYLVFQCCKTAMWLIVFLVVIVDLQRDQQAAGSNTGALQLILNGTIEAIILLVAFLATLIYASVVYHRHRIAKKNRLGISRLEHERYSNFYNGPYSGNGIEEAHYHDPHSPSFQNAVGSPTVFGESPTSNGHDVHPLKRSVGANGQKRLPLLEWKRSHDKEGAFCELDTPEGAAGELSGEAQAHELATTKSVGSSRSKGSPVELFAPFKRGRELRCSGNTSPSAAAV